MATREELEQEMISPKPTPNGTNFFQRWVEPILVFLILGLFIGMIVGAHMLDQQNEDTAELAAVVEDVKSFQTRIREAQREGETRGYKLRAIECQLLIEDGERTSAVPAICTEPQVLGYYPPEVCTAIGAPRSCGHRFEPSPYQTPSPTGA